jgi:hypothetical protein
MPEKLTKVAMIGGTLLALTACAPGVNLPPPLTPAQHARCEMQGRTAAAPVINSLQAGFTQGQVRDDCQRVAGLENAEEAARLLGFRFVPNVPLPRPHRAAMAGLGEACGAPPAAVAEFHTRRMPLDRSTYEADWQRGREMEPQASPAACAYARYFVLLGAETPPAPL